MSTFPLTDYEEAASAAIDHLRLSIDRWNNLIHSKKSKNIIITAPAFQWAQSLNYTFINVKYSGKMDSPGYLDIKNETINFTEQGLALSADVEKVNLY